MTRVGLLLDLARAIADDYTCVAECENEAGDYPLDYRRGRACVDCGCYKCMAVRAIRFRAKPRRQRRRRP